MRFVWANLANAPIECRFVAADDVVCVPSNARNARRLSPFVERWMRYVRVALTADAAHCNHRAIHKCDLEMVALMGKGATPPCSLLALIMGGGPVWCYRLHKYYPCFASPTPTPSGSNFSAGNLIGTRRAMGDVRNDYEHFRVIASFL